ncbi:MAG: hypothetical protein UY02_C0038G0002 [Candidatus Giovannonibacteria bacterium GW2011_GWB1_47_6b]|uniref:Uncharacterized protein n=1 Tax=Candidatus Giovannonibacteria bacterium GW2011_GWB1_47_6b TaxID=1618655 RepID=A0A0G1T2J4_9BACT|nr:MAG: hypothetical protein UY02_C0038G0002 [Candidatus Giovannonibacteria bacterium GW2011_GWB1_47_6b]
MKPHGAVFCSSRREKDSEENCDSGCVACRDFRGEHGEGAGRGWTARSLCLLYGASPQGYAPVRADPGGDASEGLSGQAGAQQREADRARVARQGSVPSKRPTGDHEARTDSARSHEQESWRRCAATARSRDACGGPLRLLQGEAAKGREVRKDHRREGGGPVSPVEALRSFASLALQPRRQALAGQG